MQCGHPTAQVRAAQQRAAPGPQHSLQVLALRAVSELHVQANATLRLLPEMLPLQGPSLLLPGCLRASPEHGQLYTVLLLHVSDVPVFLMRARPVHVREHQSHSEERRGLSQYISELLLSHRPSEIAAFSR